MLMLVLLNIAVPCLRVLLLAASSMPGNFTRGKHSLCPFDACEDFSLPRSAVCHLHLTMVNDSYQTDFSSTLWLCYSLSSGRHVPKEQIHSRGFSMLRYDSDLCCDALSQCFKRSFNFWFCSLVLAEFWISSCSEFSFWIFFSLCRFLVEKQGGCRNISAK